MSPVRGIPDQRGVYNLDSLPPLYLFGGSSYNFVSRVTVLIHLEDPLASTKPSIPHLAHSSWVLSPSSLPPLFAQIWPLQRAPEIRPPCSWVAAVIFLLRELYRQWRPAASGRCWSASSSRCRWQTGGRTPPGWGQTSAAGRQNVSMGCCHWAGMRNYWNFCKVSDKSWIKWVGCFSWPCEKITRQKCHWN